MRFVIIISLFVCFPCGCSSTNTGMALADKDLWAGVDNDGRIIFAHGVSYWSHYIPSCVHVNSANSMTITDPGGISRDFRFMN